MESAFCGWEAGVFWWIWSRLQKKNVISWKNRKTRRLWNQKLWLPKRHPKMQNKQVLIIKFRKEYNSDRRPRCHQHGQLLCFRLASSTFCHANRISMASKYVSASFPTTSAGCSVRGSVTNASLSYVSTAGSIILSAFRKHWCYQW